MHPPMFHYLILFVMSWDLWKWHPFGYLLFEDQVENYLKHGLDFHHKQILCLNNSSSSIVWCIVYTSIVLVCRISFWRILSGVLIILENPIFIFSYSTTSWMYLKHFFSFLIVLAPFVDWFLLTSIFNVYNALPSGNMSNII